MRAAVAQARGYTDDVEFSTEDGSRSDVQFLAEVIQIALDEGATTINVADTVGYTMLREFAAMFEELFRPVPGLRDVVLSVHCHDDGIEGFTGAGQGVSTDIIDAAARAYVRALSVAVARSQGDQAIGLPETSPG